jgi:hypothetical protein
MQCVWIIEARLTGTRITGLCRLVCVCGTCSRLAELFKVPNGLGTSVGSIFIWCKDMLYSVQIYYIVYTYTT